MNKIENPAAFKNPLRERLGRDVLFETFDPKKTALIVVDMQNYFMKEGFMAACAWSAISGPWRILTFVSVMSLSRSSGNL